MKNVDKNLCVYVSDYTLYNMFVLGKQSEILIKSFILHATYFDQAPKSHVNMKPWYI